MRSSIFKKAYEEIIKPGLIHFEMDSVQFGINYQIKDYLFRVYAKERFRLMQSQCDCRNNIFQPSLLCAHNIAGIFIEVLRQNPNLVLIDTNNPQFSIKTAFELDKGNYEKR